MEISNSGLVMGALLISFGLWQIYDQKNNLRELKAKPDQQKNRLSHFLIRQSWRRLQTGILFSLTGIGMIIGLNLPIGKYPLIGSVIWLLNIVALIWGILLTIVDLIDLKLRYNEEKQIGKAAEYGMERLRKKDFAPLKQKDNKK